MIPQYGGLDARPSGPESIETVPLYRTDKFVSMLVLVGFFFVPPLLWWACVICLTGDVYLTKVGHDGRRLHWPRWNKVAAVVLLLLQFVGFMVWLARLRMERDLFIHSNVPIR